MTKKDYVKFAEMVKYNLNNPAVVNTLACAGHRIAIKDMAQHMADIFRADNARFNRERFLQACGIE